MNTHDLPHVYTAKSVSARNSPWNFLSASCNAIYTVDLKYAMVLMVLANWRLKLVKCRA